MTITKIFFFMILVYMMACLDDRDAIVGKAYNYEDRGTNDTCSDYYVKKSSGWFDDVRDEAQFYLD